MILIILLQFLGIVWLIAKTQRLKKRLSQLYQEPFDVGIEPPKKSGIHWDKSGNAHYFSSHFKHLRE